MKLLSVFCLAAVAVQGPLVSCSLLSPKSGSASLTENERYFVNEVKPVLERNCLRCHNGATLPGRLDLRSRDMVKPGYVRAGDPDDSLLITAVSRNANHPRMMPQCPISLTDDQIGVLREWIEDGAAWPVGHEGRLRAVPNPENP